MAIGLIPDPFVADNEKRVQWVAENDWEYRRAFMPDPELLAEEYIFLVCDGLDTLAEVSLNGQLLGKTDNMFRQYRWEIKSLIQAGENEVSITFRSPVRYITARQAERALPGASQCIPGQSYLRKAPYQFGWDWAPQLPPIGVWKDIRLEGRSLVRLEDVNLRQYHRSGQVTVEATLTIERWDEVPLTALVHLTSPDGIVLETRTEISGESATCSIDVEDPQLWWPNGYGEQPLYQVDVVLLSSHLVYDRRTYQFGLRTLELRQKEDEWGKSFTFVVNGVPIFAKGSNWIPADSFPTRITDEHLETLIRDTAVTHQNMLRVWGGGFYEEDRFYDLCDRHGILIWQDMIFSCAVYPLNDEDFVQNLEVEILQNVRRLRHRASLALWCGNNEMEMLWEALWVESTAELADMQAAYDQFFHHILPTWVAAEDPDRSYWPSSPSSNTPFVDPDGHKQGDAHYWDVWHGGQPFTAYRDQFPRFMSEFGFQALPPLETIRTYAEPGDWNLTSYIMEHHQRSLKGNARIISQMADSFRMPKDFPSLVYLSLVLQAEGIRYGVEHWRRNKQRVSGSLYWQLNDCWPVASWSSLDYFGRWKALHYAARRFYAPVLLSLFDQDKTMGIHVTNDLMESWQGYIRWSLATIRGDVLQRGQQDLSLESLACVEAGTLQFDVPAERERETIFICELFQGNQRIAMNLATFVPNKHLALVEPGLTVNLEDEDHQLVLSVRAQSLARFVELSLEGAEVVFSDNYFDVPAGYTFRVTCPLPDGWALEEARRAFRVRSLYDSYT